MISNVHDSEATSIPVMLHFMRKLDKGLDINPSYTVAQEIQSE